jgi:hypothetical protein
MMEHKTDELKLHAQWQAEAKEMTLEKLPEFLQRLSEHEHDYGTICRAIAAAGIAAMWAVERGPQGGITGFQAGCIIWDVIEGWGSFDKGPKRMQCYHTMLYPQYEHAFRCISASTWEWLQKEAEKNLGERNGVDPKVAAHWQSIVDGAVPFGYRIEKD